MATWLLLVVLGIVVALLGYGAIGLVLVAVGLVLLLAGRG